MNSIPGLTLVDDYLSEAQSFELIQHIDTQPWLSQLRRNVQHYGYAYDYKRRTVDPSMHLGELPAWLKSLTEQLHHEGYFEEIPDQCIVNEYHPGQGIGAHVDCEPCFGEIIASISLLSMTIMQFTSLPKKRKVNFALYPGSLLVMRGEARYQWKHGIPARLTDVIDGTVYRRSRRISITFRNIIV